MCHSGYPPEHGCISHENASWPNALNALHTSCDSSQAINTLPTFSTFQFLQSFFTKFSVQHQAPRKFIHCFMYINPMDSIFKKLDFFFFCHFYTPSISRYLVITNPLFVTHHSPVHHRTSISSPVFSQHRLLPPIHFLACKSPLEIT